MAVARVADGEPHPENGRVSRSAAEAQRAAKMGQQLRKRHFRDRRVGRKRVELLGRPNGVGFEIGIAFQLFDVTRILAYALAFIAVMLAIETFLVQPLERHVARWRPRPA